MPSFQWNSLSDQPMLTSDIRQDAKPDEWVRDHCVIQVDDEYLMFHTGKQSTDLEEVMFNKSSLWRCTSSDGKNWRYRSNLPYVFGSRENTGYLYQAYRVYAPWVLPEQDQYHVWFTNHDGNNRRIQYACFDDSLTPIGSFMQGGLSLYHETDLSDPAVIRTKSDYLMAFTRGDGPEKRIGFAYSDDAKIWTQNINYTTDLWPGEADAWDSRIIWCPSLMYDDQEYRLWYLGTNGHMVGLGMARSSDGRIWKKDPRGCQLALERYTGFDQTEATSIMVVRAGQDYMLFYTTPEDQRTIRQARSVDGIDWHISNSAVNLDVDSEPVLGRVAGFSIHAETKLWRMYQTPEYYYLIQTSPSDDPDRLINSELEFRIYREHFYSSWESLDIGRPWIVQKDGKSHMWYAGASRFDVYDRMVWQIGYATFDEEHMYRFAQNPVLTIGPHGSWDGVYVADPCVYWDGHCFQMWYAGYDGVTYRIGHAVSPDGIAWDKNPENPIFSPQKGSWEEDEVRYPCVLFQDGRFQMWYRGRRGLQAEIGYAHSVDGKSWRRHDKNPVLTGDASSHWDRGQLECPSVVKQSDSSYRMWYAGFDWKTWRIGYAESKNGIHWEKTAENPVLSAELSTAWDMHHVQSPCVIQTSAGYRMWYAGLHGTLAQIGTAVSTDGKTWTPDSRNPVVTPRTQGWDSHQVDLPSVVYHDGLYRMWYSGFDGFHWRIGFAESEDGITWHFHPQPVLEGTDGAWDSDGVWSSSVLWDGTCYMMWYAGTRRSVPNQDRNTSVSPILQSSDIGLATSIDGLVWVKHESGPVIKEGDNPNVIYVNGIYRLWYNFAPQGKVITTQLPPRYTTSQNGISWRSDTLDIQTTCPAYEVGVRQTSVLLCGDRYLLWYHTTAFHQSRHRHIKGFEAVALDIARIRLKDLRMIEVKPHEDWSEIILESVFVNEGPGEAQAVEVKLLETESGVRSLSPEPILHIGDLKASQTASPVEPLRLLIQGSPKTQTLEALDLHWEIAYTDTVMGDRQVYETGKKAGSMP